MGDALATSRGPGVVGGSVILGCLLILALIVVIPWLLPARLSVADIALHLGIVAYGIALACDWIIHSKRSSD